MQHRMLVGTFALLSIVAGISIYRARSLGFGAEGSAMPPAKKGNRVGVFAESLFKFSPVARGDGQASDWQEASATLGFTDGANAARGSWTCNVVVGMPLRSESWGELKPDYAAYVSAASASDTASALMPKITDGSREDFCNQWRAGMQRLLDEIDGLGAKVSGSE